MTRRRYLEDSYLDSCEAQVTAIEDGWLRLSDVPPFHRRPHSELDPGSIDCGHLGVGGHLRPDRARAEMVEHDAGAHARHSGIEMSGNCRDGRRFDEGDDSGSGQDRDRTAAERNGRIGVGDGHREVCPEPGDERAIGHALRVLIDGGGGAA